jgi:magnesium-transporting ATPase (P-type)
MTEKPKERSERIVSKYMTRALICAASFIVAASLVFLFSPVADIFTEEGDFSALKTGFFTFFVFAAIFNAFNARTERTDLFENIGHNAGFLKIMGIIAAVQVAMVYLGGSVMECHGLSAAQWLVVLAFALPIIPIDLLRKKIGGMTLKG